MRLSYKVFMTAALIIIALLGVAAWSLMAINRLVEVNRGLATQALPALRMGAVLREQLTGLMRVEQDAASGREEVRKAWNDRAARMAKDFDLLRTFLGSDDERTYHHEATVAFATYRRLAATGGGIDREVRGAAERTATGIDRMLGATYAALDEAQVEARQLEDRTWNTVYWWMLAAVAMALAATGFLTLHMTRALRGLTVATAQLAEGAFTKPLPVSSRDEIGQLSRSFNRMAERLHEVEQLKEEFFSHISHELRTPLTSVKEATHLLLERVPGELTPKQKRLVEIIGTSSDRLLRLVNQVLELSRLRARVLPLERRRVDMEKVVARALDELRPQAEERGQLRRAGGRGPTPSRHGQSHGQCRQVHAPGRLAHGGAGGRRRRARDLDRGHGRRHSRGRSVAHLRSLQAGAPGARRLRAGPRHRQGPRGGPRRDRVGGVRS